MTENETHIVNDITCANAIRASFSFIRNTCLVPVGRSSYMAPYAWWMWWLRHVLRMDEDGARIACHHSYARCASSLFIHNACLVHVRRGSYCVCMNDVVSEACISYAWEWGAYCVWHYSCIRNTCLILIHTQYVPRLCRMRLLLRIHEWCDGRGMYWVRTSMGHVLHVIIPTQNVPHPHSYATHPSSMSDEAHIAYAWLIF